MGFSKQQRIEKDKLFAQGLKQCPRCPEPKEFSEFGEDKNRKDGLKCFCKEHHNKQSKEYQDKPEIKEKRKQYREKLENKVKIAKYLKEYHIENREKRLQKLKEYRDKPENKHKANARQNNRKKTDINFKIKLNLRTRICKALNGNTKSLPTMFLIGCEVDYLMYHIQEKFTDGMSWDNHGLWHIDHIKPCSKFDLTKESEQLICFNYTNLQPLWALDNLKKGSKYVLSF